MSSAGSKAAAAAGAPATRRIVRRAIHPRLDLMRVVLTNGATVRLPVPWLTPPPRVDASAPAAERVAPSTVDHVLEVDPCTHPAWTGRPRDARATGAKRTSAKQQRPRMR